MFLPVFLWVLKLWLPAAAVEMFHACSFSLEEAPTGSWNNRFNGVITVLIGASAEPLSAWTWSEMFLSELKQHMVTADQKKHPQMSPDSQQHADQQTASWLQEAAVNYKVPPVSGASFSARPLAPPALLYDSP